MAAPSKDIAEDPLREGPARYAGYASRVGQFVRAAEKVRLFAHCALHPGG